MNNHDWKLYENTNEIEPKEPYGRWQEPLEMVILGETKKLGNELNLIKLPQKRC